MSRADRQNRLVTGVSLVLLMLVALLMAALQQEGEGDIMERPSTLFTDDTGARAIWLITTHFQPEAIQLRTPIGSLRLRDWRAQNGTLIVQGPSTAISPRTCDDLENWVEQGGQLVLAIDHTWSTQETGSPFQVAKKTLKQAIEDSQEEGQDPETTEPDEEEVQAEEEPEEEHAGFLDRFPFQFKSHPGPTAGPLRLTDRVLAEGDFQVLARDGEHILAGAVSLGQGRIVVVPDPQVWSNQRLSESDNAAWLIDLALSWGNGMVYFDEYHHGFREKQGLISLIRNFLFSKWGIGFLQLFAVLVLWAWGPLRRFGTIREPRRQERHDPLELIAARAGLFRQARATGFCMQMIHQYLLQRIRSRNPRGTLPLEHADQSETVQRYLALHKEAENTLNPNVHQLAAAAGLAGQIIQEYHHERHSHR